MYSMRLLYLSIQFGKQAKSGFYPVPSAGVHRLGAGEPRTSSNVVPGAGAPKAAPQVRFLMFYSCFWSFFRLKTPMNLINFLHFVFSSTTF